MFIYMSSVVCECILARVFNGRVVFSKLGTLDSAGRSVLVVLGGTVLWTVGLVTF